MAVQSVALEVLPGLVSRREDDRRACRVTPYGPRAQTHRIVVQGVEDADDADADDHDDDDEERRHSHSSVSGGEDDEPTNGTLGGEDNDGNGPAYTPRPHARKNAVPVSHMEGYEPASVLLPRFGIRDFASWTEFLVAWSQYATNEFVLYRTRDSKKRPAHNEALLSKHRALVEASHRGGRARPPVMPRLLPADYSHAFMTLRCTHGCYQKSRSKGKRATKTTRFLACDARITARVIFENGRWVLRTSNEHNLHNHKCTTTMASSARSMTERVEKMNLLPLIKTLISAQTPTRNICDIISQQVGDPFTSQHLANIKRDKFGIKEPLANLRELLHRFNAIPGSSVHLVKGHTGKVRGIALQSAAQRAYFDAFGDNLVMDFTYNTNNYDFNLGSLMVTGASGGGVPVFDFLCLDQTKDMIGSLLDHFIAINPGAQSKVITIVIDKDYTEWVVLKEKFPLAKILLCQFHVSRRFKTVVYSKDSTVPIGLRGKTENILNAMIHASTETRFAHLQRDLDDLLRDVAPDFLEYMQECWYNCYDMWSNCARDDRFTALNNTTNRVESNWSKVKLRLGRRTAIDMCVEALLAHLRAVLQRELVVMKRFLTRVITRSTASDFMRPMLRLVSDYTCDAITKEWGAYTTRVSQYTWLPDGDTAVRVRHDSPNSLEHRVCKATWRCTCRFSISAGMPCRHIMLVAHFLKAGGSHMPMAALADRWRLDRVKMLFPVLQRAIEDMQGLRLATLYDTAECVPLHDGVSEAELHVSDPTPSARVSVSYLRLRRGRTSDAIVLDNMQKRVLVTNMMDPVQSFLAVQSMSKYNQFSSELDQALSALLARWQGIVESDALPAGDLQPSDAPGVSGTESRDAVLDEVITDDDASQWNHDNGVVQTATAAQEVEPDVHALVASATSDTVYTEDSEVQFDDEPIVPVQSDRVFNVPTIQGVERTSPALLRNVRVDQIDSLLFDDDYTDHDYTDPFQWFGGAAFAPPSELGAVRGGLNESPPYETTLGVVQVSAGDVAVAMSGIVVGGEVSCESAPLAQAHSAGGEASTHDDDYEYGFNESEDIAVDVADDAHEHEYDFEQGGEHGDDHGNFYDDYEYGFNESEDVAVSALDNAREHVGAAEVGGDNGGDNGGADGGDIGGDIGGDNGGDDGGDIGGDNGGDDGGDNGGDDGGDDGGEEEGGGCEETRTDAAHTEIDLMVLDESRKRTSQRVRSTVGSAERVFTVEHGSKCPVPIQDFNLALRYTENVENMFRLWQQYDIMLTEPDLLKCELRIDTRVVALLDRKVSYAISLPLNEKLLEAFQSRPARRPSRAIHVAGSSEDDDAEYDRVDVVTLHSKLPRFTVRNVLDFSEFHRLNRQYWWYNADIKWLRDMEEMTSEPSNRFMEWYIPYLRAEIADDFDSDEPASAMARMVRKAMETKSIASTFSVITEPYENTMTVEFGALVGRVCGDTQMTDMAFLFILRLIGGGMDRTLIFDPVEDLYTVPQLYISEYDYVVFPVCYEKHWMVITVVVEEDSFTAVLYDSTARYGLHLEERFRTRCEPLLRRWWLDSNSPTDTVPPFYVHEESRPRQADSVSGGVYCIAYVVSSRYSPDWIDGLTDLSAETIAIIRLRSMWAIFAKSAQTPPGQRSAEAYAVRKRYEQYLAAQPSANSSTRNPRASRAATTAPARARTTKKRSRPRITSAAPSTPPRSITM